jgi:hypothetical protein
MLKFCAWIILFLLLVVPFFNWRLGATFWMCALLVFICRQVFSANPFKIDPPGNEQNPEEKPSMDE